MFDAHQVFTGTRLQHLKTSIATLEEVVMCTERPTSSRDSESLHWWCLWFVLTQFILVSLQKLRGGGSTYALQGKFGILASSPLSEIACGTDLGTNSFVDCP